MKARDFVSGLVAAAPSVERLRSIGLDEPTIRHILGSSKVNPIHTHYRESDNILEELQQNFDLSTIDIGMLTFFSQSIERNQYYDFGGWDTNWVGWNKATDEVHVISSETYEVLFRCANSLENFLAALIECKFFFNQRLFDDALWDDMPTITKYASKIANSAGGSLYEEFYRIFLGIF